MNINTYETFINYIAWFSFNLLQAVFFSFLTVIYQNLIPQLI